VRSRENATKHGQRTAARIAARREIADLMRLVRADGHRPDDPIEQPAPLNVWAAWIKEELG
jgi:hypothetical protein